MKRVTIKIDPELDVKFKKKASQKHQFEKGWYSLAVEDAMRSWITENKSQTPSINDLMNSINPNSWKELRSELKIEKDNPFENMEDLIHYIDNNSEYDLKIERERDHIIVKLENKTVFTVDDLDKSLKTLMMLHLLLKIIISSLEETTKDKYVISGIGTIPTVYINKIK